MQWAANTIILAAATLTALAAILTGAWKIFRAIDKIEDTWTVLSEIADQFEPNSGKSLYDRITHLEEATKEMRRDLETVLTDRPPRRQLPISSDDIAGHPV